MEEKKKAIIVLAIVLLSLTTTLIALTLNSFKEEFNIGYSGQRLTANAVANAEGLVAICINNMPNISTSPCSKTALVGIAYSCTVLNYDTDINQTYNYTSDTNVFTINITTGKISFTPNSSQEGTYFINITCYDSSNCANNHFSDYLNLTVRQPHCGDGYCVGNETCSNCPEDCGPCPSPSPSGGGGSSGGITPTQNVQVIKDIPAYTPTEIKILNTNVALTKLNIEVNNEVKNVELNISGPIAEKNLLIPKLNGLVYQYFEATAKNLPNNYIITLNHILRVPKNWLIQNKVSDNMISYYTYENNAWISLSIVKTGEDTNYVYYTAKVNHFSYFAVGVSGFSTNLNLVKISLKPGDTKEQYIAFSNKGGNNVNIKVDVQGITDFIEIDEPLFLLGIDETKTIKIRYRAPATKEPGIYTGQIILNSDNNKEIIDNIIEIESADVIFDLSLDIPLDYKEVVPGQIIRFTTTAYSIKDIPAADTIIVYEIKDKKGNVIYSETEERTIGKQSSWTKEFALPHNLASDEYVLAAQIRYGASAGTASEQFKVVKTKTVESPQKVGITNLSSASYLILILSIVLIVGGVVLYNHYKLRLFESHQAKEISGIKKTVKQEHEKLENITLKRARLIKQIQLLEHSFKQGYIREKSYKTSTNALKKELEKLKR